MWWIVLSFALSEPTSAFFTPSFPLHLTYNETLGGDFFSDTDSISICVTGESLGYLDPCGCRAKQRGGIPRRDTVRQRLAASHRNVLLVDNGDLIDRSTRLDLTKADTLIQAMNAMGYAAMSVA